MNWQNKHRRRLARIDRIDVLHEHESPGCRPICYICGLPVEHWKRQTKCSKPSTLPALTTKN